MSELIVRIGQVLFEQPPNELLSHQDLRLLLAHDDEVAISDTLLRMRVEHLIAANLQGNAFRLSMEGRNAWDDGSIVEVTLGRDYIATTYGPATVHIIVTGANGEFGGSGFFTTDYPGWIVTAAHVVSEYEILRVANWQGGIIAEQPFERHIAENGLDLALIRCDCPVRVKPIRIDWGQNTIRPTESLLVLGFPGLGEFHPGLDHISAELRQVAQNFRDDREYLLLSSQTPPGSSGGPVLNRRGRAVGVVQKETVLERLGQDPVRAYAAIPARYLSELRPPG